MIGVREVPSYQHRSGRRPCHSARRILSRTSSLACEYEDAPAAIEWLVRAFGFEKGLVVPNPDGTVGNEVICPAPYWTTYPEAITLAGGVPVILQTDESTGFKVSVDQLDAALTPRTKALLFVSPDNPSGAVYTPAEVEAIGKWAVDKGVWVLTDEIYEHLVFGNNKFVEHAERGAGTRRSVHHRQRRRQDDAMTGWRVGWMIGPADVMKAAINFQSHSTSNVDNVAQVATSKRSAVTSPRWP